MNDVQITIDSETATALKEIHERYFFDLFKPICKNAEDEYRYRDAINTITEAIEKNK